MIQNGGIYQLSHFTNSYYFLYLGIEAQLDAFCEAHLTGILGRTCSLCLFTTASRRDVKRHIESQHVLLKIACKYCTTILKTRYDFDF